MALPATSTSPATASHPHSQQSWLAEHSQRTHGNTPHGQKRRADEDDEIEDRSNNISTNFKRLRINNTLVPARAHSNAPPDSHASITSHPAYHPPSIQAEDAPSIHHPQPSLKPYSYSQYTGPSLHTNLHPLHAHLSPNRDFTHTPPPAPYLHPPSRTSTTTTLSDEPMTLDIDLPTDPNRMVITDLDAEIAEIEASERAEKEREQEHAFFLPDDIDKEISGVPARLLRGSSNRNDTPQHIHTAPDSQALILYKDPFSISIPEEEDAVKKAVVEARRRMRERQKEPPPPSPFSERHVQFHDVEQPDQAEPYIRNGLSNHSDYREDTRDQNGRFGREQTPFPFPNPNVRQPVMSAPYIPIDIDEDAFYGNDIRHDTGPSNGGHSWDDDAMEIE